VLLGLHPLVAREPRVLLGLGLSLEVEGLWGARSLRAL